MLNTSRSKVRRNRQSVSTRSVMAVSEMLSAYPSPSQCCALDTKRHPATTRRLRKLCAVHQPHRHIAVGVGPENVALAIAVEVPCSDDRPCGRDVPNPRRLRDLGAVEEPHRHITAGFMPEPVSPAVAVKVALTDHRPGGGYRAETRRL